MLLKCTRDLANWLDYSCKAPRAVYDDFYAWGADFIRAGGLHYYLLLRNSATGFALLFDFLDTDRFFSIIDGEGIIAFLERGLIAQGFDAEDVAFYLDEGEHCTFTREFERAYERKKLKDLSVWAQETGLEEARTQISDLPVTINRRTVDAKALFADLLKERRKEITRELFLAVSMKVRLRLSPDQSVWRRFHLPKDITYRELHDIIQVAFGWDGMHLHEFKIGKWIRIMPGEDISRDFGWGDSELLDEERVTLGEANQRKMTYIYDFGANWVHDITLEKVLTVEEEQKPICVGGEGTVPSEGSGSLLGFLELLGGIDPDWDDDEFDEDDEDDGPVLVLEDPFEGDGDYEEDDEYDEEDSGTPFDQEHINAQLKRMFP